MEYNEAMNSTTDPQAQPHALPASLSSKQLTQALIVVTLLPFCLVVYLYTSMPDIRDPVLPAEVEVGPASWPSENAPNARLVPCVLLTNPTDETWNYINLSINDQFHFAHPDPLPPKQQIAVPLTVFHTKGNAHFPPESQKLKELTIYAQIATGARAILVLEEDELDFDQPAFDSE